MIQRVQTYLLICVFVLALLLSGCGGKGTVGQTNSSDSSQSSGQNTDEKSGNTIGNLVLEGPGNTSANLLHDGIAAEYDGSIYYVDKMMAGSIWKMPVGGGESTLIAKGTFHDLNVNGGVIFAVGNIPNADTGLSTYGIFIIPIDGGDIIVVKEGDFEELILYDEYLYFADIIDGGLYRMKYDGSDEKLLLEDIYGDYAIVDGALYLYASLGEDYTTNVYKMPLDGSAAPKILVEDTFGGAMDISLGDIFYISRDDETGSMYRYKTDTGQISVFLSEWVDDINTDGQYLYYFWTGNRQDNADSGIYRVNPDGSGAEMILLAESLFSINIAGDKMFWHNNDDSRRLTVMNLDGTDAVFVEQASE